VKKNKMSSLKIFIMGTRGGWNQVISTRSPKSSQIPMKNKGLAGFMTVLSSTRQGAKQAPGLDRLGS
jgi:hypothetical protein